MVDAYRSRGDGDSTETLGLCLSPGGRTTSTSIGFTYPGYSGKTSTHSVSASVSWGAQTQYTSDRDRSHSLASLSVSAIVQLSL